MEEKSKRLPIGYGHDDDAPINPMNTTPAREQSKENAAGSPHPKANQDEGRAGRMELGSEKLGVKEEHFNRERARAHGMGTRVSGEKRGK